MKLATQCHFILAYQRYQHAFSAFFKVLLPTRALSKDDDFCRDSLPSAPLICILRMRKTGRRGLGGAMKCASSTRPGFPKHQGLWKNHSRCYYDKTKHFPPMPLESNG